MQTRTDIRDCHSQTQWYSLWSVDVRRCHCEKLAAVYDC